MGESAARKRFPAMFWLVILFEFFERGSYYGMMSILSVYFTEVLNFPKDSVGVIKSVIQPILYFLPIVAGALADRFGYRKALTVAFSLLGTGYFLTAQATEYTPVFLALVVMALGAGVFKPIVSGTIARMTDKETSSLGFGIYYWSINLGAFLFPLILVPWLKSIAWSWVMIAAALCTGAMLLPTLLFFKDPSRSHAPEKSGQPPKGILKTVADAFEIVYSPLVLILHVMGRKSWRVIIILSLSTLGLVSLIAFLSPHFESLHIRRFPAFSTDSPLSLQIVRNELDGRDYELKPAQKGKPAELKIFRPDDARRFLERLVSEMKSKGIGCALPENLAKEIQLAEKTKEIRVILLVEKGNPLMVVQKPSSGTGPIVLTVVGESLTPSLTMEACAELARHDPRLALADSTALANALKASQNRPFFLLFIILMAATGLLILFLRPRLHRLSASAQVPVTLGVAVAMAALLWLLPGLSLFSRILCTVIYMTLLSLFSMDPTDTTKYREHFRFLLMIFLYSGFWILYFQMFDSVLWYVQAYIRADALNAMINGAFGAIGIGMNWHFDVEHVTVINAGTIICLQLIISKIFQKTPALPTMITGIVFGSIGMGILAISPSIWVFLIGNIVFSVGEMTAHPKFFSYVGQIAPKDRVAMYMGYSSLYGVIGSSIAGVLGANLYQHYVDNLNQPRTLWLIFTAIGAATVVGLILYNRFLKPKAEGAESQPAA